MFYGQGKNIYLAYQFCAFLTFLNFKIDLRSEIRI